MIEALRNIAERAGLNILLLSSPDNIEYLTGVPSVANSALLLVYDRREERLTLYVPLLEYYRYRDSLPSNVEVYAVAKQATVSDIPVVNREWDEILTGYRGAERVGADLSHRSSLARSIEKVMLERVVDISSELWRVRMVKSNQELESITRATRVTLKGVLSVYTELREHVTEAMLAGIFEKTIRDHGAESLAFEPIIAFKPNNAYPHTLPGLRTLKRRDLVLVDVGVKINGRCSDITRLITYGRPEPDERRAIEATVEATYSAIDVIKPGVKASEVYEVAARVLDKYGLRNKFIHGLGHGVGVVVHEPPYIRADSNTVLEPGMVFTVEPGVYFPGKYGVRVEELVLVTERRARVLSRRLECVLTAL